MKRFTQDEMRFIVQANEIKHYYEFLRMISWLGSPNLCLELGTSQGFGSANLRKGCPSSRIITVDIVNFQGEKVEGIEYWNCDSCNPLEELQNIDILFIDTDHDGIRPLLEFNVYSKLLSENAVVLFDDIKLNEEMRDFWKEFNPEGFLKFDLPIHSEAGFGCLIKQWGLRDLKEKVWKSFTN